MNVFALINALLLMAIFIVLIFGILKPSTGAYSNASANPHKYEFVIGLWLIPITINGLLHKHVGSGLIIFYPVFTVFIFPSFVSYLTSRLGAYKISYLLGRMSLLYFGRSTYAGALYRGLQAADRIRCPSEKTAALYWLKSRYLKRSRAIYSGEMALIVIIEAKLKKPGDARYVARQLDLLDGISEASIPGPVSRYVSKIALAPALSDGNWTDILRKAKQWDTPGSNPIAQYLIYYFHRHIEKSEDIHLPAMPVYKLAVAYYKRIYRLPDYLHAPSSINIDGQEMDVLTAQWLMRSSQRRNKDKHWYIEQFTEKLSEESKTYWLRRSRELGIWNPDQGWKTIEASVHEYATMMTSKMDVDDIEPGDAKEQRFKNLKYISESIKRRLKKGGTASRVGDFLDWMNLWQNLSAFKSNHQEYNTAFTMIHDMLWDWISHMWDSKTNRCLALYMATVCAPIAEKCGLNDFRDTLRGIEWGLYD